MRFKTNYKRLIFTIFCLSEFKMDYEGEKYYPSPVNIEVFHA
jgi:hypothetical protein